MRIWPLAHHATQEQKFSGTRIITANSDYPQHICNTCKKGYIPIAYAPQESTSVQNVSVIILHVPKTIFQQTVNICSTNAIHAKKGMYLLPMLPKNLPVCRMFRLSSCMYRKQSFNTGLNSAAQKQKNGMPMTINSSRPKNI